MSEDAGAPSDERADNQEQTEETGASETRDGGATSQNEPGEEAPDEVEEPITAADRSLPPDTVHALYEVSRSDLSGPTAFGERSTVIGVVNQFAPVKPDERFRTEPMSGTIMTETCTVYTPTGTDGPLRERLMQRHVVYLSGRTGTGRHTAAYAALAKRHGHNHVAYIRFAADARPDEHTGDPRLLLDGHGHVLDATGDSPLTMPLLMTLERHAEQRQATVVVIGRTGKDDAELSRYLVRHTGPAPLDVFVTWLEHQLRTNGKCVAECEECRGECIEQYLRWCRDDLGAHLDAVHRIAEAMNLARRFADHSAPRGADALRLLSNGRAGLRAQAETLLQPQRLTPGYGGRRATQHQRAFRLAYAVLDGHPLHHVFHATGLLIDELDRAWDRIPAGRSILELDVETLLGEGVRAEPSPAAAVGTARTARLHRPRLVDALLDVAWNDYDSTREPLLNWIRALVDSGHGWPRAAAIAGRLCAYDFEQVYHELIDRWAVSPRIRNRQAAALACESAAYNEHLTNRILRVVRGWAAGPSANRRDCAARVYATGLFVQRFSDYALTDLKVIARDRAQRRNDSVPWTIQRIYNADTAGAVMTTIAEWGNSEAPHLCGLADRCLVVLAGRPPERPGSRWPELLGHVRGDLIPLSDLALRWPSALRQPTTSLKAWGALEYWIGCAEDEPEIQAMLHDLLSPALDDRSLRARTRFYLDQVWRRRMPNNPFLTQLDSLLEH